MLAAASQVRDKPERRRDFQVAFGEQLTFGSPRKRSVGMPGDKQIVYRGPPWWPPVLVIFVAFCLVWLMGWGLSVACLVAVVANVIVTILMPRRFGRWTE